MEKRTWLSAVVCLVATVASINAQPRVDSRNTYERCIAIVPMVGAGTFADPKRPLHAPTSAAVQSAAATRTGILGFTYVLSDDGTVALVEFVARDRSAFQAILADPTAKSFLKGKDAVADVEAEFQKYKKGFDMKNFGVRMP